MKPPIQHPVWQLPPLQTLPLPLPPQLVPFPSGDHCVALTEGWQDWQEFVWLTAPVA
jgi:predicted component of type VI protein secretion system